MVITQAMAYLAGSGDPLPVKSLSAIKIKRLLDTRRQEYDGVQLAGIAQAIAVLLDVVNDHNVVALRQFYNSLLRLKDMPLAQFAQYLFSLAEQEYYDPTAEAVSLLTIHAAKGLEFSQVFVISTEEGILPLSKRGQVADLAEERRLFYVAATRARDGLHLLHARSRAGTKCELSRFVADLPAMVAQRMTDPAIGGQLARGQKRAQKRSQASLF